MIYEECITFLVFEQDKRLTKRLNGHITEI